MIAVVILNWNGVTLLQQFLPTVVATTDPSISRIIVADNGSSDNSVEWVRNNYPKTVDIIEFSENYGFAEGYNKAIAQLSGYEYCVLLNSDAATTSGWDHTLLKYMEAHPNVAACQPKILSYRDKDTFEYAGASGGFIDRNGYPYCRGRIFGYCEKNHGQYDEPMEIFWASGACLLIRRQAYIEAGGLDPAFFAHMEEIDLCWRLQLMRYKIAVVPQAVVYHLGGGSLPADNPKKTYLNFRNNLLMMHKNLPENQRRWPLIKRRLLDTLAWAKYMATFDFKNANAILKAHRHFSKMRKKYNGHTDINLLGIAPGTKTNILVEHYVKNRKRYDQLNIQ